MDTSMDTSVDKLFLMQKVICFCSKKKLFFVQWQWANVATSTWANVATSKLAHVASSKLANVATSKLANVATWRYGATLATWQYGATLATWQMHTHAHFFRQRTMASQVWSTSTRSASRQIHATALGWGYKIGNSNGDRQIVFGEKLPRQTRSVAPPKRLRLLFSPKRLRSFF